MNFYDLMQKRASIRKFTNKEVEEELLQKILEVIRLAPSAGNLQPFRVKIVKDEETKRKLAKASFNQNFIIEAPIVLVFFAYPEESKIHYGERGERLYSIQDATVALYTAHLMAEELGLGSVWVGAFNDSEILSIFNLSKKFVPVGLLPIGYKGEFPSKKKRKSLEELLL